MNLLIVDDEKLVRNLVTVMIGELGRENLTVREAGSVDEALKICDEEKIDFVLTDIMMPQRTGLDLIQELSVSHANIRIAVLSAFDDYKYVRSALRLGALDYLLKSDIQREDLVALLSKVELDRALYQESDIEQYQDTLERIDGFEKQNESFRQFLKTGISDEEFSMATGMKDTGKGYGISVYDMAGEITPGRDGSYIGHIIDYTLFGEMLKGKVFMLNGKRIIVIYEFKTDIQEYRAAQAEKINMLILRNLNEYSHNHALSVASGEADSFRDIRKEVLRLLEELEKVRSKGTGEPLIPEKKETLSPVILRTMEYVESHFGDKLTLDAISAQMYTSKAYLCQMFTNQVGISIGSYIENIRIDNAMRLLRTTNLPISDIAERTGYRSQSYFTKAFGKRVGVSPMRYRSTERSEGGNNS